MTVLSRIGTAFLLWSISALVAHAQADADAFFREGNSLFRSGAYRDALERYQEAADLGLESAVLYYNTGVAAFRAGEYEVAEAAFEQVQPDPSLGPIATYNLGLTYRELGRNREAEQAFRTAAELSTDRSLTRLADRAANSDTGARREALARDNSRNRAAPEQSAGGLRLQVSARLGHDDNVYRTPSEPYTDYAAPGFPVVSPVVQSASFMPVDLLVEYEVENESRDTLFRFTYRLDGDFYASEFSSANRMSQQFVLGADIERIDDENRTRRFLRSSFYLTDHDETNFDPDSGLDREFNGEDISGRHKYRGAGVRFSFEHAIRRFGYGLDARLEGREHQDVPLVPSYDHNLLHFRLSASYDVGSRAGLRASLLRYQRAFDDRLARNLDAQLLTTNEVLRYDYSGIELGISYRISRALDLKMDYLYLDRRDEFEGYFDSIQDQFRLEARYRPGPRISLVATASVRYFFYPVAFAFNDPVDEFLDTVHRSFELRGEYQFTSQLSMWAAFTQEKRKSTDPRLPYERMRSLLGIVWQY